MIGLTYIRNLYNMSMEDLGKTINVSKQTVSKWESNITPLSNERINQFIELFKLPKHLFQNELTDKDKIFILENEIKRLETNIKDKNDEELFERIHKTFNAGKSE